MLMRGVTVNEREEGMSNCMGGEETRALASFYRPAQRQEQRVASVAMVTKQASQQAKRTTTQGTQADRYYLRPFCHPGLHTIPVIVLSHATQQINNRQRK